MSFPVAGVSGESDKYSVCCRSILENVSSMATYSARLARITADIGNTIPQGAIPAFASTSFIEYR